jgi:hypothetical protein
MERRGFIKGMLASIAGSVATVQLARPGEAAALVTQRDLLLAQPEPVDFNKAAEAIMSQHLEVYARVKGQMVVIGYLRSVEVTNRTVDLYTYEGTASSNNPEYVRGMRDVTLHFGGPHL